jgi:hypothetical protein
VQPVSPAAPQSEYLNRGFCAIRESFDNASFENFACLAHFQKQLQLTEILIDLPL